MSEVEHAVKVFPIDASLQGEVKKLESEGWELSPGVVPIAVYHVVRIKGKNAAMFSQSAQGNMGIDDTKVSILRDGKLVN